MIAPSFISITMNRTLKKLRNRYRRFFRQIQPTTPKNSSDPWRCEECGSRHVYYRAWVDGNTDQVCSIDDDREDLWCNGCKDHTYQIRESELMKEIINPWWNNKTSVNVREKITGLVQKDFDPQEDYRAFQKACDYWWNTKTNEEKIEVWRFATRSES